jgi:oligoribonuclease
VNQRDNVFAWVDLEMTGLDPETCVIIQMAMVLTDQELNEIAPPIDLTIWQPESKLELMSPFVRHMHSKTGLLDAVRRSDIDLYEAEKQALEILSRHSLFGTGRLAGNSVWQDRRFLSKFMPAFDSYLHYRLIDVSTLKELAGRWYEVKFPKPNEGKHTAMHDVRQSIAELKFYRERVFR